MPTLKLTQAAVNNRKPPASGREDVWDAQLPGFGLRISASGQKTWQAFYRVKGKMVREKLGTLAQIPNVAEARELARQSMTKARSGAHPVEDRRRREEEERRQAEADVAAKANTLAVLLKRYVAERPKVNQKGRPLASEYLREIASTLDRDVAKSKLGSRPITEIDGKDIRALLRDIAKTRPGHSRHVHAYLTTAFQWLNDEGLAPNLLAGIKPPAPKVERDRALEKDYEIRLFWHACDEIGWPFGPLYQLLVLLGPRRDELACATRLEFDLPNQTWELPGARTKNGEPQITHLPTLAGDILEALPCIGGPKGYVFTTNCETPVSGFGRAAARVETIMRKQAAEEGLPEIEHFTRHDLRRSLATGMAKLGVAPHVVDKILNHSGGTTITGVAKIYNRFKYSDERKAALDAWSRYVESLIRSTPSNVVELPRRAGV